MADIALHFADVDNKERWRQRNAKTLR